MDLKRNKRLLEKKKLRTICYNCKLHGSVTFGDKNNKTDNYIHKCNGRPFREDKKWYKIINITILKSTENLHHVTRQNYILLTLHTIKKLKVTGKERTDEKRFDLDMIFLDWNGRKLLPMLKKILGKRIIVCANKALRKRHVNKMIVYTKFYSLFHYCSICIS